MRPTCANCGKRPCEAQGRKRPNEYRRVCHFCRCPKSRKWLKKFGHRGHKKYHIIKRDVCRRCGFVPESVCQMDVDHVDGNHENNDYLNLQSLCSNCHRLKTHDIAKFSKPPARKVVLEGRFH